MCYVATVHSGCGHSAMFQISCPRPDPDHCDPSNAQIIARYRSRPPCLACHTRDWGRRQLVRRVEIESFITQLATSEARGQMSRDNRVALTIQQAFRDHRMERRALRKRVEQRSELVFMRDWACEHAAALLGARYDWWRRKEYEKRLKHLFGVKLWEVEVDEWPRRGSSDSGTSSYSDAVQDRKVITKRRDARLMQIVSKGWLLREEPGHLAGHRIEERPELVGD
ncbi:hypothetical protein GQ53DRAFT_824002 [Thozetella sp. PMI_491]|nr:hypothetical protein GQ53DRAFT_824002 [Thozetella sp. PMI_491]